MILRFQESEDFYTFVDIAIRQFRKDNGVRLTRGALNRECGFSNSFLQGAKRRNSDVGLSYLLTVCQLLGYEVIVKKKSGLDLKPDNRLVSKARRSPRRSVLGKGRAARSCADSDSFEG